MIPATTAMTGPAAAIAAPIAGPMTESRFIIEEMAKDNLPRISRTGAMAATTAATAPTIARISGSRVLSHSAALPTHPTTFSRTGRSTSDNCAPSDWSVTRPIDFNTSNWSLN